MTRTTQIVLGAFLALLVLLGVQQCRTVSLERALSAAKMEPQKQAVAVAQAKVETVTVRLQAAERTVTRVIERVRTDTLVLRPVTAQDTARALAQLPTLAAAHDSLRASCSAFVVSCGEYRAASEARDTAQRARIAGLEGALRTAQPSRLGAVWNRIKLPLAFGAGLYAGLQVAR